MDINKLLSPQETERPEPVTTSSPAPSPRSHAHRVRSGSVKHITAPLAYGNSMFLPSSLPPHLISPQHRSSGPSPLASPTNGHLGTQTPLSDPSRTSSTQNIDAFAELAYMQCHQPQRPSAQGMRSIDAVENQLSPSTMFPTVQAVPPPPSNPRSSFDLAMAEAPRKSVRSNFQGTSLRGEFQEKANMLAEMLQTNPYDYASHSAMVNILHQNFVNHVYPPDSPTAHGDPHSYDLLGDLRVARENMDKIFAIGEDLWADWIQDESMLARTVEERIGVMEKCVKAVEEEYGSTKLWVMYGEWMLYCFSSVQQSSAQNGDNDLSEEDRTMGREVFTWQRVLDTWKQGSENTKWRINDSHLVWNRYVELLLEDLKKMASQEMVTVLKAMFEERFQVPHANWEETSQLYSGFVTTYFNADYEAIMSASSRLTRDAKNLAEARQALEFSLIKAQNSADREAETLAFAGYIDFERESVKHKRSSFALVNALFERAALRFPSNTALWEDHAVYMTDEAYHGRTQVSPLPMLHRATRHCPWSGSLWSQYLLGSERAGQSFQDTADIKHKATHTGVLDVAGIDEVLKVHVAWCGYLRRRAFRTESSDEDLDVAEVGIRSSIENLQELSAQKLGKDHASEPVFRLERLYIKYLSDSGSWDSARQAWRGLIPKHGDSWEFWSRYYAWEMMCWSTFIHGEKDRVNGPSRRLTTPQYATGVFKDALKRPNLDWPEGIMQLLLSHCEDHEDVEELQLAIVEVKRIEKQVAERRQKERTLEQVGRAEAVANGLHIGKRKREDGEGGSRETSKKQKPTDVLPSAEEPATASEEVKRDREHATILVQNLPEGITETRLRQFFRDCGTINSLKLLHKDGTSAVIEFEEKEAAFFAQSRSGKLLDDSPIEVQTGSGSTLYVANFPPTADEAYIQELFEQFGDIVDVRFPSLKFDTHRRFCYVQFKFNSQAQAATYLDGSDCGEGFRLLAKLSDPLHKQSRSGPMEEGREVYVRNVNWSASEDDIRELFSGYGDAEAVRIPRKIDGKSKGIAFVVFPTHQEACAALAMHDQSYKSRTLHVELSSKVGAKRQATTIVSQLERSKSLSVDPNGAAGSPSAISTTSAGDAVQTFGDRRERTIGLMNVPDTVNDSRIRALAEQYGKLIKVTLRPDHQGAIIEYADVADAGRAAIGLQGYEITPMRRIGVGQVQEMLKQKAEYKTEKIVVGTGKKDKDKPGTSSTLQTSVPIRRPVQQASRRGGLGQKRGLGFRPLAPAQRDDYAVYGTASGHGKRNDDFRAMLEKK